ncbi:MAG TPA: hypothetical protein VN843_11570 [Anaerolineales bacterium]|nr:hypothetical protein [Anaerolineales bacterium]
MDLFDPKNETYFKYNPLTLRIQVPAPDPDTSLTGHKSIEDAIAGPLGRWLDSNYGWLLIVVIILAVLIYKHGFGDLMKGLGAFWSSSSRLVKRGYMIVSRLAFIIGIYYYNLLRKKRGV